MLEQEQFPKGTSLRNVHIEKREMCPVSSITNSVENIGAVHAGEDYAVRQDHVGAEMASALQHSRSQHHEASGEPSSCQQPLGLEIPSEVSSHSCKPSEKSDDHHSNSSKLLSTSSMASTAPMRKPVDIMMHKDRINLLRQMSQVFNEEQHVAAAADVSSASEDEREDKDSTKENMISRKKSSNACPEKPASTLEKRSDVAKLRTVSEMKRKSASNGALKPLVSNASTEVGLFDSEALVLSGKSKSLDESNVRNETDLKNSVVSPMNEPHLEETTQPKKSSVETNAPSTSVSLEAKQGKVYHVSSYSKRVQEKISVKSFVGKSGEHVDVIDGFSFVSFEDKSALLNFELPSTSESKKLRCGKTVKKDNEELNSCLSTGKEKSVSEQRLQATPEAKLASKACDGQTPLDASQDVQHDSLVSGASLSSSTECSAFSSSRLDEFLCKNKTLNISYDVPECRKTVEGVSKVWDEDGQDSTSDLRLQRFSSQKFGKGTSPADSAIKTLPNTSFSTNQLPAVPNGLSSSSISSKSSPSSPFLSNTHSMVGGDICSNISSSESLSTKSPMSSLPCKRPKAVSKPPNKGDRKFLRPKSSEVFVCRGGKLVPLASIIKRGAHAKVHEKKKTSDLIYVYHDGKFLTMGGSLCNVDPRYSKSLTSQVVLPINLINKPNQKRKNLSHNNFRAVLIDKRMADFALSALRKPIPNYKEFHKNGTFVRNGPLNCRRQGPGVLAKVKPRTTKSSSILDIISEKLAIDVGDSASHPANENLGNELELRDSKLVQKNLHRFPSLSREMKRLDKKYVSPEKTDGDAPSWSSSRHSPVKQQRTTVALQAEDVPFRGNRTGVESGVRVKRCEVKVPWYRLPPSLKVWCLVHHCYDCNCGLTAPPANHTSLLSEQHRQEEEGNEGEGENELSARENGSEKAVEKDGFKECESKEGNVTGNQILSKVNTERLSQDSAFTALLNSKLNRESKEKESMVQNCPSFETSKSCNSPYKNASSLQSMPCQRMSGTDLPFDCGDKSVSNVKTHLDCTPAGKKAADYGSTSTTIETSTALKRPWISHQRKREGNFGQEDVWTSSKSKKFKVFIPKNGQPISNMKPVTEASIQKRASVFKSPDVGTKSLDRLSFFGSSFTHKKNLNLNPSLKMTDDHDTSALERNDEESITANLPNASDGVSSVGPEFEEVHPQRVVLPECVILELCVGQREGAAGRTSGPTIHNIIKHWSHDSNHSARTCGYSKEGKTYRAVVNPQKQGFDYTPPIAPCNSNATIKSVLSAFLKRGYIRDVQNEDGTLKYEPEEANAVYCSNRNIAVVENKAATPAAQILLPREGCQSPVRPLPASPTSVPASLKSNCTSSKSINCDDVTAEKIPLVSSCITNPVVITIPTTAVSSSSSSMCNSSTSGEMKLKIAWKRGQYGDGAAVANSLSLPEMMQAEERRGELELDLSPAPPGTAMLVTEARFRKLINMNIIGVTGLNKQSRCIIAPVESSEMLAKMRFIQTQISNRLLDVGPNMRDIFFPPHQPTGTVVKPRFIMIRCDKFGSWEIVGLVQKKSSEHQADNVHFTTSDIFDQSSARKAYGGDQPSVRSDIPSVIGAFKKSSSLSSAAVSVPPSSSNSSCSNQAINVETSEAESCALLISEVRSPDAAGRHKPASPIEHETLHLSSETSVTNCRTKPLPSLSSEVLTSTKPTSLCTAKLLSDGHPKSPFHLASNCDPVTSESSLLSSTISSPTSSNSNRSFTFSKISSPTSVKNREFPRMLKPDVSHRSSPSCQTSTVISCVSSSRTSIPCEPAPVSSFSQAQRNQVHKVPFGNVNSLLRAQTPISIPPCSSSGNGLNVLETDAESIVSQHKDSAVTSHSSLFKDNVATSQCSLFKDVAATSQSSLFRDSVTSQASLSKNSAVSDQPSILKVSTLTTESSPESRIESQRILPRNRGGVPGKMNQRSEKILSSSKLTEEAYEEARIISPSEKYQSETQVNEVKNREKLPVSLPFAEPRPSELSSLSMTSENATNSIVSVSLGNSGSSEKEFRKPAFTKGMKWAAIDLSINFKSIKLGWLKGTIQKSILAQIRATSLESLGVVTFTVRASEEETILYGRSKVMRKPKLLLLILGSSIAALDLAYSLSNFDLFKNNMMAYVMKGDSGERTSYRYITPNFLVPIESKKDASSPSKQRGLPVQLFRENNISGLIMKGSMSDKPTNEQSSKKSSFPNLSTDAPDPMSHHSVSDFTPGKQDGYENLDEKNVSSSPYGRPKTVQLFTKRDSGCESITVSSEANDGGMPQSAVLSCHEITLSPASEASATEASTLRLCPSPEKGVLEPGSLCSASDVSSPGARPVEAPSIAAPSPKPGPSVHSASKSVAWQGDRPTKLQIEPSSQEIQSGGPANERELSICLSEDSVQIFPAEDETACDEVTSLTVSSAPCDRERTMGARMKLFMRRNSFIRTKKAKAKARKGSKLLQRYTNGCQGKEIAARAWRSDNVGPRAPSSFARMRAAVARGHSQKKNMKGVKLKKSRPSNAGVCGAHSSGFSSDRQLLELTEGTGSDGYGSSSGSSRASRRQSHGRGKDSSHNEMERLRRKEIGELFVELQAVLQQEKGDPLPDCKKEVWPKRMTLKMAISLLEAKREQQWVLARKEDALVQQFHAKKRRLRQLIEHSLASAKDKEAAEDLLKRVALPNRAKELDLLEQWTTPAAKRCRPDSSDEEYVLDVEGSDSNTSEDLCSAVPTPASSPPYAIFPRTLSTQRTGQKRVKVPSLTDSSHLRRHMFVPENGKRKKLGSSDPCKSGRGPGSRLSLLTYDGSLSRDSSSDAADDVTAAAADSGGESSSASETSAEAPPSLSFSTLSFSNLPSQLLPSSMCSEPLLPSASKPSSPHRDLQ